MRRSDVLLRPSRPERRRGPGARTTKSQAQAPGRRWLAGPRRLAHARGTRALDLYGILEHLLVDGQITV